MINLGSGQNLTNTDDLKIEFYHALKHGGTPDSTPIINALLQYGTNLKHHSVARIIYVLKKGTSLMDHPRYGYRDELNSVLKTWERSHYPLSFLQQNYKQAKKKAV